MLGLYSVGFQCLVTYVELQLSLDWCRLRTQTPSIFAASERGTAEASCAHLMCMTNRLGPFTYNLVCIPRPQLFTKYPLAARPVPGAGIMSLQELKPAVGSGPGAQGTSPSRPYRTLCQLGRVELQVMETHLQGSKGS